MNLLPRTDGHTKYIGPNKEHIFNSPLEVMMIDRFIMLRNDSWVIIYFLKKNFVPSDYL